MANGRLITEDKTRLFNDLPYQPQASSSLPQENQNPNAPPQDSVLINNVDVGVKVEKAKSVADAVDQIKSGVLNQLSKPTRDKRIVYLWIEYDNFYLIYFCRPFKSTFKKSIQATMMRF